MNNAIKCVFTFIFGAAIGSVAAYMLLKEKYKKLAQEEIDEVKEYYHSKFTSEKNNIEVSNHPDSDDKSEMRSEVKKNIDLYKNTVKNQGYNSDSEKKQSEHPYVISPNEFGDIDDYERVTLYYYADEVLVDEDDELVEDVDNTVGLESLTHFGEYEDDSVFVRNDRLSCDYEILLDQRTYSDAIKKKPHQLED